ncbi:glycosyltransferase family 9 protein [bacterium]|nr:glycosyltransferase family 9 protein [bacterium]
MKNVKSVLIIRCGALGDLVCATAVSNALIKEYGGDVKIDWVSTPGSAKLLSNDPHVNQIFLLRHKRFPVLFSPQKRAVINYSRHNPYDLMINLETGKQFFDLAKAVSAKHKIGAPFTYPKISAKGTHIVDYLKMTAAAALGSTSLEQSYPKLYGTPWEEVKAKYALPDTYLMLNPSNSHNKRDKINYRAWPENHWSELIEKLASTETLLITAGPGEAPSLSYLKPLSSKFINLIGKTSIPDLITIIGHARAIVTTDTGPTHIASAVNTPIFVLMGPTPLSTGPYKTPNNQIKILSAGLECSPCYGSAVMKACQDNICMKKILPDDVVSAIEEFNKTNAKIPH